jgi:hypothetical protein
VSVEAASYRAGLKSRGLGLEKGAEILSKNTAKHKSKSKLL